MNRWTDEAAFEEHFYALQDPQQQIKDLAEWREFQTKVVSKFIAQIQLVAGEHYSNLDHFLLELLQNADDNNYPKGSKPTIWLTLDHESFCLANNEKGFTAQDLFAITYAAASTKTREKTKATFIGEKGIGFKSVFAVADSVDIHSPPFHFRLDNGEFIIPHLIPPVEVAGTSITLRLRDDPNIPSILSRRLSSLCENAQEFILFLQRLENLIVDDRVSGSRREVTAERDSTNNFYIVQSGENEKTYFTYRYTVTIPNAVVRTRFSEVEEDLEREIVMAVPYPSRDGVRVKRDGCLFCFLPTKVKTCTPVHLQLDAKTIANRENLVDFDAPEWNRTIFQGLDDKFVAMCQALTGESEFAERLPEYLPWDANKQDAGNKDLQQILLSVQQKLGEAPIIRDRHGKHRPAAFVKSIPKGLESIFYEDKYEKALSRHLVETGKYADYDVEGWADHEVVTLVDLGWAEKYPDEIQSLGVQDLDDETCLRLLQEGPPTDIDIEDHSRVRQFLTMVLDFSDSMKKAYRYHSPFPWLDQLKKCQVFPLHDGKIPKWGALTNDVMYMKTDTPDNKGTAGASVIDAAFTFSPGGGLSQKEGGEELRYFNKRFREFLDDCNIVSYSVVEHLRRTIIKTLCTINVDINDAKKRRVVNEDWFQLYQRIWRRKTTIIRDEGGENYWEKILQDIGQCKIPVRLAGKDKWELRTLRHSFIGPQFLTRVNLDKLYHGHNAPIIELDSLRAIAKKSRATRQRKVDFNDWREFLQGCGGKIGPYLVEYHLASGKKYRSYSDQIYQEKDDLFAQGILNAISSHPEYAAEKANDFRLESGTTTFCLDSLSQHLLGRKLNNDFLVKELSTMWPQANQYETTIRFLWGYKEKPRVVQTKRLLLHQQLNLGLEVQTDKGLRMSSECFEDTSQNRNILANLVAYVDCDRQRYNRELLLHIGMSESITPEHIVSLIARWYRDTPGVRRSPAAFTPVLEMVERFARQSPQYLAALRAVLKLYSADKDQLVPLVIWKETAAAEYPQTLFQTVVLVLEPDGKTTIDSLLGNIRVCTPMENYAEGVLEVLVGIGRLCESQGPDGVPDHFERMLREQGLHYFGETIRTPLQLPILWDHPPLLESNRHILSVSPDRANDDSFRRGADALGWPRISRTSLSAESVGSNQPLNEQLSRQVFYAFDELTKGVEKLQPRLKRRIEALGLFGSPEKVGESIRIVDEVVLKVIAAGTESTVSLPYWYDGNSLLIDRKQELDRVLPEFVDLSCGTTFVPSFRFVWKDKDLISRSICGTGQDGEASSPPPHPGSSAHETDDTEESNKSPLEEDLEEENGGNEEEEEGEKSQHGSDRDPRTTQRKRSRLCSLVVTKSKRKPSDTSKDEKARTRIVEKA